MFKYIGRLIFKFLKIEVKYRGNWNRDNKWLIERDFKTIIDIGANEGQFAQKMRLFFPKARIISFEPIPKVYNILTSKFRGDKLFTAICAGVGNANEERDLFINIDSAASSLLKMGTADSEFADLKETEAIKIKIQRLDDSFDLSSLARPIFIKMDVQGYEDKVIEGGIQTILCADIILTEVSYYQLYENQKLFHDIYSTLIKLGFSFKGNYEQLYSPVNKTILQADAIFTKD